MPNPSDLFHGRSTERKAATRSGVEQWVREWEPQGSAPASILILHGIAEHSGRYEHVGSAFADAGYFARSYDHHGFGKSGGKRGHVPSFDHYLDDVEDHLTQQRSEGRPVVLLGHSMGGLIASAYAMSDRPQPDVLLLSGPAFGAIVPAWQRVAAPVIGRVAPSLFIKSELDGSLLATDPDVGVAYRDDPLRVPGATAGLGKALFDAMDQVNAEVNCIRVPTFVVHGGNDRIVPAESTEIVGAHDLATRVVLDGLEHEVLNEPSWPETLQMMIEFADHHLAAAEG